MTSLSTLLQQIKEKEERDLAFAKKIKKAETMIKSEQDNIKKMKVQKRDLSDGLKRKHFTCSEKEITKEILQQQKQVWEDLLQEARKDLREQEKKFDEARQSVCLHRLAVYNDIKGLLDKKERTNSSNRYHNKSSNVHPVKKIKIEQDEEDLETIMEELASLEIELEELKTEEIQIEEAKSLKAQIEAEPSCGKEFTRIQKDLKEIKDALKNAAREVLSLKNEIAQKELEILSKRSTAIEDKPTASQDLGENPKDQYNAVCKVTSGDNDQGNLSVSKTVTFKSSVEMKTISPRLQNRCVSAVGDRAKLSQHRASRKKLAQHLTSQLDETMRDILFNDKM